VNVIVLQVFVSLMLVVSSLLLFAYSMRHRDHEHAERLSLFPLEDDAQHEPLCAAPEPQKDTSR
jgi:cbb3-type cytochrome oxidase subunit 3